jgi:hypothetical protein
MSASGHSSGSGNVDLAFFARIDSSRHLAAVLGVINWNKNQFSTVGLTPKGMLFSCDEAKILQAHAFIPTGLFQEYVLFHCNK